MSGQTPTHPLRLRRDVTARDAEAVEALVRDTGFFTPEEIGVARELVEETVQRGTASGYAFVCADMGEDLAGYACFGEIPATEGRFDLYWIAVSPRWQRHGIGSRLLTAAEGAIAEAGGRAIYIETSSKPGYEPTRRFYLAAGYRLEAQLANFYRDGDDKLIYVKWL